MFISKYEHACEGQRKASVFSHKYHSHFCFQGQVSNRPQNIVSYVAGQQDPRQRLQHTLPLQLFFKCRHGTQLLMRLCILLPGLSPQLTNLSLILYLYCNTVCTLYQDSWIKIDQNKFKKKPTLKTNTKIVVSLYPPHQ